MKHYYLDSAAHVTMLPAAQKAYIEYQNSNISPGHPNSPNQIGKRASSVLEQARMEVAMLLGAEKPNQIIFTNTCTEACNWGVEIIFAKAKNNLVEYSPFEHPAIRYLTETKTHIKKINIENGKVNEFSGDFNICMQVQNEVGLIQPIENFTGYLFSDMSQSLGKIKIDLKNMNVDLAVFSGHKIGAGPVGILYIKNIKDWINFGYGSRYFNDRVGSPDIASCVAFSAGLKSCIENMDKTVRNMKEFQRCLESSIILGNVYELNIVGISEDRVPSITALYIPKIANLILNELSEKFNIHCSLGSACSSKLTTTNPTMEILGYNAEVNNFLRISSNGDYGKEEGNFVAEKIIKLTKHYRKIKL